VKKFISISVCTVFIHGAITYQTRVLKDCNIKNWHKR